MKSIAVFTIFLILCLLSGCIQVAQPILHTPLPQSQTPTLTAAPTQDQGYPTPRDTQTPVAYKPSPIPTPFLRVTATTPPLPEQLAAVIPNSKGQFAYIGLDGQLWLANPLSRELKRITEGMAGLISHPTWSSDGKYLAYRVQASHEEKASNLWLYDAVSGQSRLLVETAHIGEFDWQPGTHIITYGIDKNKLMGSPPDIERPLASIQAVNIDGGEPYEFIPARETDVLIPHWAGKGKTLGFVNWTQTAWVGEFNCYSTDHHTLSAWKKWIGNYDLSPDGHWVVYDNDNNPPSSPHQLMINTCEGNDERVLVELPKGSDRAVRSPVFSPSGQFIAYIEHGIIHGDAGAATQPSLMLLPFPEGAPRQLVSQSGDIAWLPDESGLIVSTGLNGQYYHAANGHWMGMITVIMLDGTIYPLVMGDEAAWQPLP